MTVVLTQVIFQNQSGVKVPLTIQAPKGTEAYSGDISPGQMVTIPIAKNNCECVTIIVAPDDKDHGRTQDLCVSNAIASSDPTKERFVYLTSVTAIFSAADITGNFTAST
jgi:hypothetical protein